MQAVSANGTRTPCLIQRLHGSLKSALLGLLKSFRVLAGFLLPALLVAVAVNLVFIVHFPDSTFKNAWSACWIRFFVSVVIWSRCAARSIYSTISVTTSACAAASATIV